MFKSNVRLLVSSSFVALLHASSPGFAASTSNKVGESLIEDAVAHSSFAPKSMSKSVSLPQSMFDSLPMDDFVIVKDAKPAKTIAESFFEVDEFAGTQMSKSILWDNSQFTVSAHPAQKLAPVVDFQDGKVVLNPTFTNNVQTYAEMEQLSYALVKGFTPESTAYIEKFQKAGWQIKLFNGVSGHGEYDPKGDIHYGDNLDTAGFVAFNPATGEAVVVFHGSQDAYDWANNFDTKMVQTRENGFIFHGKAAQGNVKRYNSSKEEIYEILQNFYRGHENNFHITVTGHSLGGAMGELGHADLATNFAKKIWGQNYNNADLNRVRAYLMSAALVFDNDAAEEVEKAVGAHNILQDAVEDDPVHWGGGESMKKTLENAFTYGPVALGLKALKTFGVAGGNVEVANPQAAAQLYTKGRHAGYSALQSTAKVQEILANVEANPGVEEKLNEMWFHQRWLTKIKGSFFAPIHYGSTRVKQNESEELTQAFEPRLIQPQTLQERLEKNVSSRQEQDLKDKQAKEAQAISAAKPWWKVW